MNSTLTRRRPATRRAPAPAAPPVPDLDIVFVAWNRLEFTRAAFELLVVNTDWSLVRRLIVYDDGSDDGTREYLRDVAARGVKYPTGAHLGAVEAVNVTVHETRLGSPVAVMRDYLGSGDCAAVFAKIDNDIAVPPGWLPTLLNVWDRAGVQLLGMEAGRTGVPGRDHHPAPASADGYSWESCSHIGGVGLMATSAFHSRPPIPVRGRRFGFTEWQSHYDVPRAWIYPDLFVPQLDRVPLEPWRSLSREYVGRGWQREWPDYSPRWMIPYFDWLPGAEAALAAAEQEA